MFWPWMFFPTACFRNMVRHFHQFYGPPEPIIIDDGGMWIP